MYICVYVCVGAQLNLSKLHQSLGKLHQSLGKLHQSLSKLHQSLSKLALSPGPPQVCFLRSLLDL